MRILMTADTIGGVWRYTMTLCRGLAGRGVEVVLATFGAPLREEQRREVAALPNVRLHESALRLEWMEDPWEDVARGSEWLLELERATRPDVVHLNELARGALPWRAPALVVGHSCVASWWRAVHGCDPPGAFARYRAEVAAGLRGAAAVVAPTRAILEALRECHDFAGGRVIHNSAEPRPGPPPPKEALVLAAGRVWDEGKNLLALDRAAAGLPWPVYVAGELAAPDGRSAVLRSARPLGRLPPSELAGWYGRAAIFAHPARYEPFGLAPLEAAGAGCALVLGDIPALRELWEDAARFVSPGDEGALRDALADFAADPGAAARYGRAARERARRYTPERMTAAYVDLYEELRRL